MTTENPPQLPPVSQSTTQTNAFAILSLIMGILGFLFFSATGIFGTLPCGLMAVISGHVAHSQIRHSQGSQNGGGMATAGLIMGYLELVGSICLCLFIIAFLLLIIVTSTGTAYEVTF